MTSFFPEPGEPRPGAPDQGAPDAGPNGFRSAQAPVVRPAAPPRSRWAKSDVSFGPVGRTVGTVLLVAVGGWLLAVNLIGSAVWWAVVVPWALRDLWRPVARRR